MALDNHHDLSACAKEIVFLFSFLSMKLLFFIAILLGFFSTVRRWLLYDLFILTSLLFLGLRVFDLSRRQKELQKSFHEEVVELRKVRDEAVVEVEKERQAAASAAEEALAMILRLQCEKGMVEWEARQYRKVTEEKLRYDTEVIRSSQWMVLKLEAERKEMDA